MEKPTKKQIKEKYKRLIFKCIIIFTLIIYSLFSFAQWDLNPANWGNFTRVLFVELLMVFSVFTTLILVEEGLKEIDELKNK
ncbi:hypothetical protein [Ornithobacterium rhinotracheale]|uniref:hypothetical protein n=1 Tax=Ornithobacterium rhinotracheale TaxID=28251 RepID=UPI0040357741